MKSLGSNGSNTEDVYDQSSTKPKTSKSASPLKSNSVNVSNQSKVKSSGGNSSDQINEGASCSTKKSFSEEMSFSDGSDSGPIIVVVSKPMFISLVPTAHILFI